MQTVQIGTKRIVVIDDKVGFYAQSLGNAVKADPAFARKPLATAMMAILEAQGQVIETDSATAKATANGDGEAARYFNPQRFIAPPNAAGQLEGVALNACLALNDEASKRLTDEQRGIFAKIDGDQVAQFVQAARETQVRCNDGRLYDVESYAHELTRYGSADAQMLLGVFGLEDATAARIGATVAEAWHEGGVRTGNATKARKDLGIEVPAHLLETRAPWARIDSTAGARA